MWLSVGAAQYTGGMTDGRMDGKGEFVLADGTLLVRAFPRSFARARARECESGLRATSGSLVVLFARAGVKYVGKFKDGMFHGEGKLIFPNGGEYASVWDHGREVAGEYKYKDGLVFGGDDWSYLTPEDRRFYTERLRGEILPAGDTQLRNELDPVDLPPRSFDIGGGLYYSLDSDAIHEVGTHDRIRDPSDAERQWILTKCAVAVDGALARSIVMDEGAPEGGGGAAGGGGR